VLSLQPIACAKQLQPGVVDQQIQRPGGQRALAWQSFENYASETQGGVVGGLQINFEQLESQPHQTLGLSQGLAKY
jgi:hypothetical protein